MLKQMGKFTKSYGRYVFFALLVIVCISFALTPGMMQCDKQAAAARLAGKMFKKDVPRSEYEDVRERWKACGQFLAAPKLQDLLDYLAEPKMLHNEGLRPYLGRFVLSMMKSEEAMNSLAWRVMVYLHEARDAGVQVTDSEVSDLVTSIYEEGFFTGKHEDFDQQTYINLVPERTSLSIPSFEETMREALILKRYFDLVQDAASVTTEDVFKLYTEVGKSIRVRSVVFQAKDYEALVRDEPTRDVVKPANPDKRPIAIDGDSIETYYERAKNKGGIEQIPAKVRLEYIFTDYASYEKDLPPVTDVEIQERYEREKESYLIHTQDHRYKPLDEVKADVRKSMEDAVDALRVKDEYDRFKDTKYAGKSLDQVKEEIRKSLLDAITDDAVGKEYEKTKWKYGIKDEDKRYKPLEEVKEEIRKALVKDAAMEKAIGKLRGVEEEITKRQMEDEKARIDLEALAKAAGLTYGKTSLFDSQQLKRVEEVLGKSNALTRVVSDLGSYSVDTVLERMDSDKGSFIPRVLEKQDAFYPPLTQPLREKIAGELRKEMARKMAFHAAQDLFAEWKKRIDHAKDEWSKAHPNAKVDEKDAAWETLRRDVFERLVSDKGLQLEESHNQDRGAENAADIFEQPRYEVVVSPFHYFKEAGEPDRYEEKYWVTQLTDRYEADGKDFEAKKPQYREALFRKKRGDFMANWLEAMWKEAGVDDTIHPKQKQGEDSPFPEDD